VSIDLSSGPAGWDFALVGGRLAPVVADPGMSIGVFLANSAAESITCSTEHRDHLAR
jgi:hypothetical protein